MCIIEGLEGLKIVKFGKEGDNERRVPVPRSRRVLFELTNELDF